jgi:hypothetical protein
LTEINKARKRDFRTGISEQHLDEWFTLLGKRFRSALSQILKKIDNHAYTIADVQKEKKPVIFAQELKTLIKTANPNVPNIQVILKAYQKVAITLRDGWDKPKKITT